MNLIPTQIMIILAIFSQNPNFSIWGRRINPEPKIIALGGVATGSMKAKLQPIALPRTGGRGLIEAASEMAMIMGIIMLAEAVLEVSSVRYTLKAMERKVIRERLAVLPKPRWTFISLGGMILAVAPEFFSAPSFKF